jgi:hypothetical protein
MAGFVLTPRQGWSPPSNERWMELMNPLLPTLRIARAEVQSTVAGMRRSDILEDYVSTSLGRWLVREDGSCLLC